MSAEKKVRVCPKCSKEHTGGRAQCNSCRCKYQKKYVHSRTTCQICKEKKPLNKAARCKECSYILCTEYRKRNTTKYNKAKSDLLKKHSRELHPIYVKKALSAQSFLSYKVWSDELIFAKTQQLALHREIRRMKC